MQPLTDGLLVLRHLFGFTGTALTNNATGDGCARCLAADLTSYLDGIEAQLDVDDDGGTPQALTDGLLIVRYLFGFTGTALANGAVGDDCERCDSAVIADYLDAFD